MLNWTSGKQVFWSCEYNGWEESTLADYGVDYEGNSENSENALSFGDKILNGVYGTTEGVFETTKPVTDGGFNENSDDDDDDDDEDGQSDSASGIVLWARP